MSEDGESPSDSNSRNCNAYGDGRPHVSSRSAPGDFAGRDRTESSTLSFELDSVMKVAFLEIANQMGTSSGNLLRDFVRGFSLGNIRRTFRPGPERRSLVSVPAWGTATLSFDIDAAMKAVFLEVVGQQGMSSGHVLHEFVASTVLRRLQRG
jgi:hypothetical protein